MSTRMQQRRGTAAEWAAANPVLADGELGVEEDTLILRVGNGVSTWNQLSPILSNLFLGVNGKAYDSDRLDGLDSSAYAAKAYVDDRILTAGASRLLGVHFGSVTTFPTATGLRVGDRCYRSDLFSEMFYTGAVWRQVARAEMTSAQRVALSTASKADLYVGFQINETDTMLDRRWDGTYWEIQQWHGVRAGVTGSGASGSTGGPAMALNWPNASIVNNTNLDFFNWTNIYSPGSVYANAGDGSGGPALFTYLNNAGSSIRCNAKGRVKVELYFSSDSIYAGQSYMGLLFNGSDSLFSGLSDRAHRGTGYAGSGLLDQTIVDEFYVTPGDIFGCRGFQLNTNAATLTYQAFLQVKYL